MNETLVEHFKNLGYVVDIVDGTDRQKYIVIRDYNIKMGSLIGKKCNVGILWVTTTPYVAPPAIHTNPALVSMGQKNTQASGIGTEWQYWSRILRGKPCPQAMMAHIATIFNEV